MEHGRVNNHPHQVYGWTIYVDAISDAPPAAAHSVPAPTDLHTCQILTISFATLALVTLSVTRPIPNIIAPTSTWKTLKWCMVQNRVRGAVASVDLVPHSLTVVLPFEEASLLDRTGNALFVCSTKQVARLFLFCTRSGVQDHC